MLHFHAATLSLAECIRGTHLYAGGWVATETYLSLESSAQPPGRSDSDSAAMPREALVHESCACEGARIAPNASFHPSCAQYFHENLPYAELESFMSVVGPPYFIGCGCPVQESTLLQSLPSGSIFLRAATAIAIGTCVNSRCQFPTTMLVLPAMAA
jgi:hypothetical protein